VRVSVRVVIDGVVLAYYSGADVETAEEMPSDWEECRRTWNVKQRTATDLEEVFWNC